MEGKKASGGNHMRVRASGGGAKQQFPHLVGKGKELWAWGAEDGSCVEIFSAAISGESQA